MIRMLSKKGLPLKITTQWTEDSYTDQDEHGKIETVDVHGWLVRINGMKYPRGHTDGDGLPDWTYRYTRNGRSKEGRRIAIEQALISAGFRDSLPVDTFDNGTIMNKKGVENVK